MVVLNLSYFHLLLMVLVFERYARITKKEQPEKRARKAKPDPNADLRLHIGARGSPPITNIL